MRVECLSFTVTAKFADAHSICMMTCYSGGELTLNWLGSLLTAPRAVRQAELRQQYGFDCGCARCRAEHKYEGTPLASLMQRLHAYASTQLAPAVDEAIKSGDVHTIRRLQAELQTMMTVRRTQCQNHHTAIPHASCIGPVLVR